MVSLGLEPRTLCVWSTRDNHYTTKPSAIRTYFLLTSDFEREYYQKLILFFFEITEINCKSGSARARTEDLLRVKQTWWPLHYGTYLHSGRRNLELLVLLFYGVFQVGQIGKYSECDPDVSWTRNLLIWSQTRYHCATEPESMVLLDFKDTIKVLFRTI